MARPTPIPVEPPPTATAEPIPSRYRTKLKEIAAEADYELIEHRQGITQLQEQIACAEATLLAVNQHREASAQVSALVPLLSELRSMPLDLFCSSISTTPHRTEVDVPDLDLLPLISSHFAVSKSSLHVLETTKSTLPDYLVDKCEIATAETNVSPLQLLHAVPYLFKAFSNCIQSIHDQAARKLALQNAGLKDMEEESLQTTLRKLQMDLNKKQEHMDKLQHFRDTMSHTFGSSISSQKP